MNFIGYTNRIYSLLLQSAVDIAPVIVGSALQAGSQDMRIGKIVTGLGLIWTGAALVGVSRSTASLGEAMPKKAIRWGTACAGIAAASYGVYQVASGIWEFMTPAGSDQSPQYSQLQSKHQDSETCEERLARAKKTLLECPEAKKLWEEVEKEGSISVTCVSSFPVPGAAVELHTRTIMIAENNQQIGPHLLHEVTNLKDANATLEKLSNKCLTTPYDYATSCEAREYETIKLNYRLANRCVRRGVWPPDWHYFKNTSWTSFEATCKIKYATDIHSIS